MLRRASEPPRWLLLLLLLAGLLCCSFCQGVPPATFENKTGENDSRPRIFSPRMDYDEWTPLGRGDPLKNNPTFDYVPPVLDRVQYWLDTQQQQHTTEPSSKRDILVLGVTAKKTSPKIPEQFLKFVDGPKFSRVGGQDATSYRNTDYTGSTGAEPPKITRTTSFRNGVIDYRNQNRLQSLPASYYPPSPYYNQKLKPYTMMMPPPPMIQKTETSTSFNAASPKDKLIGYPDTQLFSTQTEEGPLLQDVQYYGAPSKDFGPSRPYSTSKAPSPSKIETVKSVVYVPFASQTTKSRYEATTAPSVSFEKSNLIYQSTQTLSGGWLGNNRPTSSSANYPTDLNQVTWQSTDYSRDHYEVDHHAAASSNHEVVVGQNANIVVDGSDSGNEEVVLGQKQVSTETTFSMSESVTPTSPVASTSSSTSSDETRVTTTDGAQPPQRMHIVVANSPSSIADLETHKAKKGPVAVVMPTNYVQRNTSDSPTMLHHANAWQNVATSEMTRTTHEAPKSQAQPVRNAITSSPIVLTDDRSSVSSMASNTMPPSHPPSVPVMPPSRHAAGSPHMFMPPQVAPQSMSMRPQNRPNHATMHLIGSMRPGFRPSSPITMSHMSPPMAHMHVPPVKSMLPPSPTMEHHQRPPQASFAATFTGPPSTSSAHNIGPDQQSTIDRRPSRLPATAVTSMTTSFAPTVSSTMEYTPIADTTSHQASTKPAQSTLLKLLSAEDDSSTTTTTTTTTMTTTTTIPPRTTTAPSLTTDPIFSHYKQPAKPIRGPMYLIIQGHSKVKTYKPTVSKHSVPLENNEIVESATTKRQLSKLEQLILENTKAGAVERKLEEKARAEKASARVHDTLVSLVESGLTGFTVSPSTENQERHTASNSVTSVDSVN